MNALFDSDLTQRKDDIWRKQQKWVRDFCREKTPEVLECLYESTQVINKMTGKKDSRALKLWTKYKNILD